GCLTILKFFYDINYDIDIYEPTDNGDNIVLTEKKHSVEEELNKLVSNIAIARTWAGTNYFMDYIIGIKIGEQLAIRHLQKYVKSSICPLNVSVKKLSGSYITFS